MRYDGGATSNTIFLLDFERRVGLILVNSRYKSDCRVFVYVCSEGAFLFFIAPTNFRVYIDTSTPKLGLIIFVKRRMRTLSWQGVIASRCRELSVARI